ncbi:MAG: aconitate hydratase [Gemmatimonadetes bacterium]|nr:aconitate hydratase [Gemmatimonadota bacterium]
MGENLTRKIIRAHLVEGEMVAGREIGLRIDQCLLQDATGTMVWQQFHSFGIPRVVVPTVQYVDHNILQTGPENADDHLFLQSMCAKYGAVFSRPGNGISHFAHLERFDVPGRTMLGSDSHTCTAGALAMLAIGAGGAEVAAAMAGEPFYVKMPQVVRVNLVGELPPWVSAKDVILELLRRRTVKGGVGKVFEYVGPALAELTVWERATIGNMTQELGATSGIFPSDAMTRRFLRSQMREKDWVPLGPDADADYDGESTVDLSELEPLIARPHSPDNVVPVREVDGTPVTQVAVGSSVNSSYRDLMIVAKILKGKHVAPNLHMTLSPGSRQILINIAQTDALLDLTMAGVRALEVACGPCIGMGAAPPTGGNSVRTFNRNFPGRSGTRQDAVWLCSPEVAAATALHGAITDPRRLGDAPTIEEPEEYFLYTEDFLPPAEDPDRVEIYVGPNIKPAPPVPPLPRSMRGEVLLTLGDNVSTDDILPGGAEVLPLRSNIPAISEYTFAYVDETFVARAKARKGGFIVAGENYGQGSSREHAAIAPLFLGIKAVLAASYARIHESNLVNFGIPPLRFENLKDRDTIRWGDRLEIPHIRGAFESGGPIAVKNLTRRRSYRMTHALSRRQIDMLLAGGLTRYLRGKWGLKTPAEDGRRKPGKPRARSARPTRGRRR